MTIAKYRLFDLVILTSLCLIIDVIGYFVSQDALIFFYVTLSTPLLMIIYIRWGKYGFISTVLVGLLHIILYQNYDIASMALYVLSILGLSSSMIWFGLIKRNHIKDEVLYLTLYFITGYLVMFFIQILAQQWLYDKIEWIVMMTRHGINIALGWVILMIAKRQEDFMIDMHAYLLKQIKQRQEEDSL